MDTAGGRKLSLTVNDERGASTPEGDVCAFAGLRSDPFYLAWDVAALEPLPKLDGNADWTPEALAANALEANEVTAVFMDAAAKAPH